MQKKIAIIGSGLAGLNCARLLEDVFEVTLFDKNSQVGGRILSSNESGYILDHGFQVFLPDYPEAKEAFDYSSLKLLEFTPGALIRIGQKFYKFSDPVREPLDALSTLSAPIGNIKDKILILKLKMAVKNIDSKIKNISTLEYLKNFGFSENMITRFFKPFFSGVFLERDLSTSAYFFSFLFNLFSSCKASIPENGMMDLPLNLLNQLKKTKVILNTEVKGITDKSISIDGIKQYFDYIVCAYDESSSNFQVVTTDYFQTEKKLTSTPTLYLNGNEDGVINHIAPMSEINQRYSPKGHFLWSVNLLTPNQEAPIASVKNELSRWFNEAPFEHVKRFTIKRALPASPLFGRGEILKNGVYQCGDQMQDPSINGALKSARLVAELILSENYATSKQC